MEVGFLNVSVFVLDLRGNDKRVLLGRQVIKYSEVMDLDITSPPNTVCEVGETPRIAAKRCLQQIAGVDCAGQRLFYVQERMLLSWSLERPGGPSTLLGANTDEEHYMYRNADFAVACSLQMYADMGLQGVSDWTE